MRDEWALLMIAVVAVTALNEEVPCLKKGCLSRCKRVSIERLVTADECDLLTSSISAVFGDRGGSGPPSIIDLSSGAMSYGTKFVDAYRLQAGPLLSQEAETVYVSVMKRLRERVAQEFDLPVSYHTAPTFFNRINGSRPVLTENDEYFHDHIDKNVYPNFDVTGLVYCSDQGNDFDGGDFVFVDKDSVTRVQPKKGLVLLFSSGEENVHRVEKVSRGLRWTLTCSFCCRPDKRIENLLKRGHDEL